MSVAQVFAERHCPGCKRMKRMDEFRSRPHCTECRSAYARTRHANIKAGTWEPKPRSEYARPGRFVVERPTRAEVAPVHVPGGAEAALRLAMEAFMAEFGFTALRVTYTELEGQIARKKRMALAREGWIA